MKRGSAHLKVVSCHWLSVPADMRIGWSSLQMATCTNHNVQNIFWLQEQALLLWVAVRWTMINDQNV
jgi:hypothetical protein